MSPILHRTKVNRRRRPLACAGSAVLAVAVLAGCGTASHGPTTATKATNVSASRSTSARTTATRTHATGTTTAGSGSVAVGALAYSRCMRAHGVTNFPDPSPGGGFAFKTNSSVVTSPAFQSAQAKCQNLMGGAPGFRTNPSKQTMTKLLRIATCMRAHGVHQFPDPLYTRPTHLTPGQYQEITDFDGATLLFPASMNLQAPAYRQALTACGAPPLGLPH
jgi:hypothetical protein